MRIKIANEAGIDVERNFDISYKDAINISAELNFYLGSINQSKKTTAAGVYAVNLIGRVFRYIFINHIKKNDPDIFTRTMEHVNSSIDKKETDRVVNMFTADFPPQTPPPKGKSLEEKEGLRLTKEKQAGNSYPIIFEEKKLSENKAHINILEKKKSYLKKFKNL